MGLEQADQSGSRADGLDGLVILRSDPHNDKAQALRAVLEARLDPARLPADLCLVLGGDGTLLKAIGELGAGPLYLGLNCGHLGFMLNEPGDPASLPERLHQVAAWRVHEIPRLRAVATPGGAAARPDGAAGGTAKVSGGVLGEALGEALAVNDIYLERASGQTAHLRVFVDGRKVVDRMVCDGIIASTALGSTAYALAAGGVACHFTLPLVQLVPINPHAPRLQPIALPQRSVVEVEVLDPHRRPVKAVADGRDLCEVLRVRVEDARSPVRLAWLEGHDPTGALIRKLLHP